MPRLPKPKVVKPRKKRVKAVVKYENILVGPPHLTDPAKKCLDFLIKKDNPSSESSYYGFHYGWTNWTPRYEKREPDPNPHPSGNTSCHAALAGAVGATAIYTFTPSKRLKDDDLGIRWTEYLLKQSPWKDVPVQLSPEFCWKKGFVIQNLDLPANLIGNFCIATRLVHEHMDQVKQWDKLVKAGVHPNVALIFGVSLAYGWGEKYQWNGSTGGHHPLDTMWYSEKTIQNFVHGKVANPNHPFKTNPQYTPCNSVWGGNHPSYGSFLRQTYNAPKSERTTRKFVIGTQYEKSLEMSWDGWVDIAMKESKRIVG